MPAEQIRLDPPDVLDMAIGEAMFTQRAIRRFDHDRPIPDAVLKVLLDAASKAPSGGNTQPSRLVVLTDPVVIEDFGALYHEVWWAKRRDQFGWEPDQEIPADNQETEEIEFLDGTTFVSGQTRYTFESGVDSSPTLRFDGVGGYTIMQRR